MGMRGMEIIGLDKEQLLQMLNEALAEECLNDLERMKEDMRKFRV